jgi:hypothetical protein
MAKRFSMGICMALFKRPDRVSQRWDEGITARPAAVKAARPLKTGAFAPDRRYFYADSCNISIYDVTALRGGGSRKTASSQFSSRVWPHARTWSRQGVISTDVGELPICHGRLALLRADT